MQHKLYFISRLDISLKKFNIPLFLQKLLETNEVVKQMRIELKGLEPILVQKSQAVEDLMVRLAEDQTEADIVRRNVTVEEAAAKVR